MAAGIWAWWVMANKRNNNDGLLCLASYEPYIKVNQIRNKKMKVLSIEAVDMGNYQHEIADWVDNYLDGLDFKDQSEFDAIEFKLIEKACKALGWHSVPQYGGLIVNWEVA